MSSRRTTLPTELHKIVIDVLAEEGDLDTLKKYGLSCRSILPLCQSHIFATLILLPKISVQYCIESNDNFSQKLENLLSIFTHNPGLGFYVRNVQYMIRSSEEKYQTFHMFFQHLPRVKALVLRGTISRTDRHKAPILWNTLPSSLGSNLSHIFSLPGFSHLHLDCISNFPIRTLLECKNLTHLTIESSDFEGEAALETEDVLVLRSFTFTEYSSRSVRSLLNAKSSSGLPVVDFTRLRQLKSLDKTGDMVVRKLLQTSKVLENMTCTVWDTFNKPFHDLLRPDVLKTLISFNPVIIIPPWLGLVNLDPLNCLPEEFEKWTSHNILQIINITISFQKDADIPKNSSSWTGLNGLANEYGFPCLRGVTLLIQIPKDSRSQETKDHLEAHQNEVFKPLIENSRIKFRFMVQIIQADK